MTVDVVGIWSHKFTLTDYNPILNRGPTVITDGTNLFWMDTSSTVQDNSLHKYTVSTNTSAKFVDETAFYLGIDPPNNDIAIPYMIFFARNIYVGVSYRSFAGIPHTVSDPVARIYKVDPDTGTVTTVVSSFPKTTNQQTDVDFWNSAFLRLYATESILAAILTEREDPAPGSVDPEMIAQHSVNGTSWFDSTISVTETIRSATSGQAQGRDYRTLGINDLFELNTGVDFILMQFSGTTWTKRTGPDNSYEIFEVGPDHFWTKVDFSEYTDDYVTFISFIQADGEAVSLNMAFSSGWDLFERRLRRLNVDNPPSGRESWSILAGSEEYDQNSSHISTVIRLNDGTGFLVTKTDTTGFPDWTIWELDINLGATPNSWQGSGGNNPSQMPSPASVDASGTFIYIASLNSLGFPILLKLDTGLATNPSVVFDPGKGGNIGVICGKEAATTVWIGGNFGDTDVLEKSENAGTTFTVKDDGTFGFVTAFQVGPDSDNRVLLADNNVNIEETVDGGTNWATINTGVGFTINAIARLATDIKEAVFGNASSVTDNIDYSLDSGANMEDFTTGVFPTDDVKSVIVN